MSNLNVTIVTGFVVKAPEQRQTKSGAPYATMRIGSSTGRTAADGTPIVSYRTVNVYGQQAEFALKNFRKGSRINAQGTDRAWAFVGQQDGQPHAELILEADHVGFEDTPRRNNGDGGNGQQYQPRQQAPQGGYAQAPQNGGYQQQAPQGYAQQGNYAQPAQQPVQQAQTQRQPARSGNIYDQQAAQQPVQQQAQPAQQPVQQAQPDYGEPPMLDISSDDLPF